jgi:hypothetical protein
MASDLPKVLISYSHDSPEHKDRVLVLSNRLRGEGIDCTIDQYLLVPPEGWPRWMEKQIRESDFVLMVCTETYPMFDNQLCKSLKIRHRIFTLSLGGHFL